MNICHLEISTFAGMSIGATHFYGKLSDSGYRHVIRLRRKLGAKDAKEMNIKHSWGGYRQGSMTECFNDKESIIQMAKRTYKKHMPVCDILLLGSSGRIEPKVILDYPSGFDIGMADRLYGEYQRHSVYSAESDIIMKKWYAMLGVVWK